MSENKKNYKELAERWFKRADDDLLYAKAGFRETGITEDACFFAQQIVEKYLKGFLISQGIEPEKTHKLVDLLNECIKIDERFRKLTDICKTLTKYYFETRYPPDTPPGVYTKEEAKQALEQAEEVIQFIRSLR